MTPTETKIGAALLDARDIITAMIRGGLAEPTDVHAAAVKIASDYDLSMEDATILIEEAIKL